MVEFNLNEALDSISIVKEMKSKKEVVKESTSIKPLKFQSSDGDSPLKKALIERINEKNLKYSDLHNYCIKIMDGNIAEGRNLASNLINGLRKRPTMRDTTFYMLCDFLDLEIVLKERKTDENN